MRFGWQELLVILVIVVLIFGTRRLKNMGSDLGGAVKGFKKAMSDDSETTDESSSQSSTTDKPEQASEKKPLEKESSNTEK